jgi:hypothetical protein
MHAQKKNLDISIEKSNHFIINRSMEQANNQDILGCKIGNEEDIQKRIDKANVQFYDLINLWNKTKRDKRSVLVKIRLYNAIVGSILMYNGGVLAPTEKQEKDLDVCHRKHLRIILGYRYTDKITNTALYERSNTKPISINLCKMRWKLLRKIINSPNSPCKQLINYYFEETGKAKNPYKKKKTLPSILEEDIQRLQENDSEFNIRKIQQIQQMNEREWKLLLNKIVKEKEIEIFDSLATESEKQKDKKRRAFLNYLILFVIPLYIIIICLLAIISLNV